MADVCVCVCVCVFVGQRDISKRKPTLRVFA